MTILVIGFIATGLAGAGKAGGRAAPLQEARPSGLALIRPLAKAQPSADQSYYQHLAAKRLRLLGMMTKARNRWKAYAERLAHPRSRTHNSRSVMSAIPHESGWLCIHSREGAWNANTGNGFYGGLQMTYGWMGLVTRADLLSPAQQMRAAETGYRRSGYSDSWMRGQWPNTYPPCAGRF